MWRREEGRIKDERGVSVEFVKFCETINSFNRRLARLMGSERQQQRSFPSTFDTRPLHTSSSPNYDWHSIWAWIRSRVRVNDLG